MGKKYTKQFGNKLKSYSALAGTVIAAANTANAQIVYTDITPDSTVNTDGGFYDLDLNNDGIFDFTFNETINPGGTGTSSGAYNKVGVSPLDSNQVAGNATGAYIYPLAMNTGDTVKASLPFNIRSSQSMASYFGASSATYGNWPGVTNTYIGLKLNISGNIYYGWARLDVDPKALSFTIKDYAYMNSVNQEIVIGATPTGIKENTLSGVFIYNDNRTVHVQLKNSVDGIITVCNTLGQEVYNAKAEGTSSEINLADVKAGVYFVTIRAQNIKFTKKIVIAN